MTSDKSKFSISARDVVTFLISIILTVIFLYFAFQGIDFNSLLQIISNSSIFWIIISITLTLLSHYFRALRWKIIIGSIKKDISVKNLFYSLLFGYGVNSVVPRLGEVSRAVAIGHIESISRTSIMGTVIVERVIDIIVFGCCVIISAFLFEGSLYTNFSWLKPTIYFGSVIIFFVIVVLVLTIKYKENFFSAIVKLVGKFSKKIADRLIHIFEKLILGFSSLQGVKNYFITLIWSAVIMLTYASSAYLGFFIFNMNTLQNTNFREGFILMSISSIGIMIPTPGGIGSYHTITKSILSSLYGFDVNLSIAYATVMHAINYFTHVISAAILFFIFRTKFKTINTKSFFKVDDNV